jgi:hypothetical protein
MFQRTIDQRGLLLAFGRHASTTLMLEKHAKHLTVAQRHEGASLTPRLPRQFVSATLSVGGTSGCQAAGCRPKIGPLDEREVAAAGPARWAQQRCAAARARRAQRRRRRTRSARRRWGTSTRTLRSHAACTCVAALAHRWQCCGPRALGWRGAAASAVPPRLVAAAARSGSSGETAGLRAVPRSHILARRGGGVRGVTRPRGRQAFIAPMAAAHPRTRFKALTRACPVPVQLLWPPASRIAGRRQPAWCVQLRSARPPRLAATRVARPCRRPPAQVQAWTWARRCDRTPRGAHSREPARPAACAPARRDRAVPDASQARRDVRTCWALAARAGWCRARLPPFCPAWRVA